jgi:MFS family permease
MSYPQRYYLIHFLYLLFISFTKTTFYLYLHDCHSLPHEDILLVFAVFNISNMVFEVPTSALGEWVGPRLSFLLGVVLKFVSAITFFLGKFFWHFCLAEIISAMAVALISGSLSAWLMNRIGKENSLQIFIIGKRITSVAIALGGLSGALLGKLHLGLPWLGVSVGSMVICASAFFILIEGDDRKEWHKKENIYRKWQWGTMLEGYRLILSNHVLLVTIFNTFLISFALASPKVFWLPFLKSYFKKDMLFLGYMWLCIMVVQFFGTFGIRALLHFFGSALRLKLAFTIFSLSMVLGLTIFKYLDSITCFILFYLALEWAKPYHHSLDLSLVHRETHSTGRVTILSLENLAGNLGNAMGLMVIAGIIKLQGLVFAWTIGGLLYALIIPCYFYLSIQEKMEDYPDKNTDLAHVLE